MKSLKKIPVLCVLIAGIAWGCIGLFVRLLNSWGIHSMEIVELRAIVTCIAMLLVLVIFDRQLLKIKLKDVWCFFGTGICSIVFFNFCYFKTISLTSLSVAAVLLYTAPAMVMIMSFFLFQESFSIRKVISLGMTFVGCVLVTGIFGSSNPVTTSGILTGLGAGFGYALYSIFSRYAINKGYHSFTITFYTFLFASIGTFFTADTRSVLTVVLKSPKQCMFCIIFGLVCTVIPYLTYTFGLKYVENGKASIIASIEPVTATILGIILYHETITVTGTLGVFLVITALGICSDRKVQNAIQSN